MSFCHLDDSVQAIAELCDCEEADPACPIGPEFVLILEQHKVQWPIVAMIDIEEVGLNLSRCFFGMYRKICSRVSTRRGAWRFDFSLVTLIFMVCSFLLQVVITYFASGNGGLASFFQCFCNCQAVGNVRACFSIDDRCGQRCGCESPADFYVYDDSKYYSVFHFHSFRVLIMLPTFSGSPALVGKRSGSGEPRY